MTRFLCFTMLFLLALPAFAQEEPAPAGLDLPQDPALLMRMREDVNYQLQDIQRVLSLVNPADTRTVEALQTRQSELTKLLREVMEQLQTAAPSGQGRNAGMMPPGMSMPPGMPVQPQQPQWGRNDGMPPSMMPPGMMSGDPNQMGQYRSADVPITTQPLTPPPFQNPVYQPLQPVPTYTPPMPAIPQNWAAQNPAWAGTSQEANLPKELTEVKQTIESLRREVSELKEIIKTLETQIQLLNRNILLSERVRDNGI